MIALRYRDYCRKAVGVSGGRFYCPICKRLINKQRWVHYKAVHWRRNS